MVGLLDRFSLTDACWLWVSCVSFMIFRVDGSIQFGLLFIHILFFYYLQYQYYNFFFLKHMCTFFFVFVYLLLCNVPCIQAVQ